MTKERKFRNVGIHIPQNEKLDYLAKTSGKSKTQLLEEYIDDLFQLCIAYKTLNLTYELSILQHSLTITAYGKTDFVIGSLGHAEDFNNIPKADSGED